MKSELAATGFGLGTDSSRVRKNENYMKPTLAHYSKFVETVHLLLKELGEVTYDSKKCAGFWSRPLAFPNSWAVMYLL